MTDPSDFAPIPRKPTGWAEVFAITGELRDVPIEEIEQGRNDWEYHFDSKDRRHCGRLGCHQTHAHGWVVALRGRRFVHIGNDCAVEYAHAGLWASNVNRYNERINAEARTAALLQARDEAQRKQFWLDNSPEHQVAIALHDSFVQQARGPLLSELEKRAERGKSAIEVEVKLNQETLDARRAMLSEIRGDGTTASTHVAAFDIVTVGEIAGLDCFRPGKSPKELQARLQRLVTRLLTWSPAEDDRDAAKSLVFATRDLAPLSNDLLSSISATDKFFSEANLQTLMRLKVIKSQGIQSIELDGSGGVRVTRLPHWQQHAA